jgi:hypothetical protein
MTTHLPKLQAQQADLSAKVQEAQAKEAAQREREQVILANVCEYLDDNDVYFVGKDDRYFVYDTHMQDWNFVSANALRTMDGRIRDNDAFKKLQEVMEAQGRMRQLKTYTFSETPPNVLNMIRRERWLQPSFARTENTWFFETLMRALGNDRHENIQHLMQVIGWKYLHPEDHQLPALCFYGSGGTGKNILVDSVLATVFGKNFTLATKFNEIEAYNDLLAGKVVALIDEAAQDKMSADTLKRMVGNQRIQISAKYQSTYTCDNTALYLISTNDYSGALRMEKNDSNRRWSVLKVATPLHELLATGLGVTPDDARMALRAELVKDIYENPTEVAAFLGLCVMEANKLLSAPSALHGADYDNLSELQQDAVDEVLREIFIEYSAFDYITTTALYEVYKERHAELNPSSGAMKSSTFYGRVAEFLDTQKLNNKVTRSAASRRPNIKQLTTQGYIRKDVYYNMNRYPDGPSGLIDNSAHFKSGGFLKSLTENKPSQVLVFNEVRELTAPRRTESQ